MNPFPEPYSVLVLDNASIHKGYHLRNICENKGVRLEFLPPYSPDYNLVCRCIFINVLFYIIKLKIFLLLYRLSKLFFI